MKALKLTVLLSLLLLAAEAAWGEQPLELRLSAEGERGGQLFELRLPAEAGAQVVAIYRDGAEYELGEVLAIPKTSRYPSYSASAWGEPGEVCASAVNAIHLLVSVENGKGRTISIVPKETIAPAAGANAAHVLSTTAGHGIFGAWAPPVGSQVTVRLPSGEVKPLGPDALPQEGCELIIRVFEKKGPSLVEIENRPGGRVTMWDENGFREIARVLRRVSGTGRFEGTLFQGGGRLRANHSGVIDISTAGTGKMGGFQIIPWDHALSSKEMQNAWDMTQWMIIGPADGVSKLGGQPPLFANALIPGPADGEKLWDIWSTYGRKSLILARINGGEWQQLPHVPGRVDDGLKGVTHLRIYYPVVEEPRT